MFECNDDVKRATSRTSFWCFFVNFEHILCIFLAFLLLSLSSQIFAGIYLVLSSLGMERRLKQTTSPLTFTCSKHLQNTRKRCEICSKLTNKNTRRQCCCSGVFIVNFEHILHLFLYLFLNRHVVAFYKTSVLRKVCILPYLYKQC